MIGMGEDIDTNAWNSYASIDSQKNRNRIRSENARTTDIDKNISGRRDTKDMSCDTRDLSDCDALPTNEFTRTVVHGNCV